MAVNCKKIRERVTKMNTAWAQSAPTVAFKGLTQTAFQAKIQARRRSISNTLICWPKPK